jgi:molybdopterin-synthase adenylyltransferase
VNDEQLLRYSRQILLPDVDLDGQEKLLTSRVLILGLGGLGAPAAMYLAGAGVGHLVLADSDTVDLTNLQRQIIHTAARIDQPKVNSAAQALRELNPDIKVTCVQERLEGEALRRQLEQVDLVLDCTDNFTTRFDLNAACVATGTPLVSGAAVRLEGQVAVFDPRRDDSPCYRCLYHTQNEDDLTCTANGVLAPVVGVVGSMQALEAIKLLVGFGTDLVGRLLLFDARHAQWRELKLARDPDCPVCGKD